MIKNWTHITATPDTLYNICIANPLKPLAIAHGSIMNNSVEDSRVFVALYNKNNDLKAIIVDDVWKSKETIFLNDLKIFCNPDEQIKVSSSSPGVHFLFNGKE